LPEVALPYLRFAIMVIAAFLTARLLSGQTLKAAAETAHQTGMPYQRGQQWVNRFQRQAQSVSAALTALVRPVAAGDFATKAIQMLGQAGWIEAHRFLFEQLREHLLGWPDFLAPAGMRVKIQSAAAGEQRIPHNTCIDSESSPA
jgi:hypothetical protein